MCLAIEGRGNCLPASCQPEAHVFFTVQNYQRFIRRRPVCVFHRIIDSSSAWMINKDINIGSTESCQPMFFANYCSIPLVERCMLLPARIRAPPSWLSIGEKEGVVSGVVDLYTQSWLQRGRWCSACKWQGRKKKSRRQWRSITPCGLKGRPQLFFKHVPTDSLNKLGSLRHFPVLHPTRECRTLKWELGRWSWMGCVLWRVRLASLSCFS